MPASIETLTADVNGPAELAYRVEGLSCSHCEQAVTAEVERVAGVVSVEVDVEAKFVRVWGTGVEDAAVRAAIDEAGYDAVLA